MTTDRRTFLQLLSTGAFAAPFGSIERALAIPAHHRHGTIADVEHIVILMQENRSFDHYFGTLQGVRGFGDPRAVDLPSGMPVWYQPNGSDFLMPFRANAADLGSAFLEGTPHNWSDAHAAWNKGKYDNWVPSKGTTTMHHLNRSDIPFHFALADAFTVCDAYHCSFMGATDPNRYHMWTGWTGNDGKLGGPVLNNAEVGYDWHTYPERLQKAGVSWKIYQDAGAGLDAAHYWGWGEPYVGNYGDNSLLYFHQYQNSLPGTPLHEAAFNATNILMGGTLFDQFRADVLANKLPQVSYIVAPEAYSEHANWPANYGAWYVSQMLDALTANPEVWSKTVLFLCFDENDGQFDHIVPPTPPTSRTEGLSTVDTTHELFEGNESFVAGPYGFGARVPMTVISPFSKGGWVNSEVFDHTSLIRFIEARFAKNNPELIESNITDWRRAVAGDLTSAFNFESPNAQPAALPSTTAYAPPDYNGRPDYVPVPPTSQELPKQERGVRPARAVPYELYATCEAEPNNDIVRIRFANLGKGAAVFQVRASMSQEGPWTYTVGPRARVADVWRVAGTNGTYDLSVYGPNGFFRSFKGSVAGKDKANLSISAEYDTERSSITLELENRRGSAREVRIFDAYSKKTIVRSFRGRDGLTLRWPLNDSHGWYDLSVTVDSDPLFEQRFAGHVETGRDSVTDPMIAQV